MLAIALQHSAHVLQSAAVPTADADLLVQLVHLAQLVPELGGHLDVDGSKHFGGQLVEHSRIRWRKSGGATICVLLVSILQ